MKPIGSTTVVRTARGEVVENVSQIGDVARMSPWSEMPGRPALGEEFKIAVPTFAGVWRVEAVDEKTDSAKIVRVR